MKFNLPTKLTLLRLILVPICMVAILYPILPGDFWWRIIAALLFILTALTDMLDGKLARKMHLVTDFGKFLDPLADKMMIIGVLLAVILRLEQGLLRDMLGLALFVVILRELAVTSLRMIASGKKGLVIAATMAGKIKTTLQIVCVVTVLVEPILPFPTHQILSYITVTAMTVMTVWSGIGYFQTYLPLINPNQ